MLWIRQSKYLNMTLDQLEVFEKVVEKGSFRAAADSLHRAQSAVSYGIRELERSLEVQLFSRKAYRPTLTPAGEALLSKARGLLVQAREIQAMGRALGQGEEACIVLGVSALCDFPPVIEVIRRFSARSATRIELLAEVLGGVSRVREGKADLAITEVVGTFPEELERTRIGLAEMVPVVSRTHPLAANPCEVRLADLKRYPQIVLSSTTPGLSAGVVPGVVTWRVADFLVKREAIRGGVGWGRMVSHLVQEDLDRGDLVEITAPELARDLVPLYLVRRRGELGPGRTQLWDMLSQIDTPSKSR